MQTLLRIWPILFVICLTSCKTGPRVTVCVSYPPLGLTCYDEREERKFITRYEDSDKYVCMPPEDARTLLEYCNHKDHDP